ncbi:hypothetical protein [Actinoplanes awajinensis]|uniref:Uncharacterized protein n=1 Tax=Actinoplanes awajinensis subsp. mycoplanecinus TaxID=135947 RepID=A0A0X3V939_9ACTN|nr:hypothetical protein [Actinoplanes awajinensis]KUL41260.1 hypothetical protein ADL15_05180 [Actinoplanes awajinensis subsp. mycoplanecinus]
MVSVEPGLTRRWRSGSNAVLLVRSPEDPDRVRAALTAGLADIAALGPAFAPEPIAVPAGHLMIIDFGTRPPSRFATVPDLIAGRLVAAGITDAAITTPGRIGDRYAVVTGLGPIARAWLRGPVGRPLGDAPRGAGDLLRIAAGWVRDTAPGLPPRGVVVSAEVELAWPGVVDALLPALRTGAPVSVVASDFATTATVAAVAGTLGGTVKQATLTAAGQDVTLAMRAQRDLARAEAERLAWAGVEAAPTARDALSTHWEGRRPGGEHVPDLIVPAAMWFQVLSPGHLARLGGPPPGAEPLGAGRVGLTVGEPEQWLPGHPDEAGVRARAGQLLAACLVDEDTGLRLMRERLTAARARDTDGFFPGR